MKTSQAGIDLIKEFEGLRLNAYQDSVGVWTVGYGHTKGVKEGDTITEEQADWFLREDLKDAEKCVTQAVTGSLEEHEFSALVSFVFNLGCTKFRASTLLRKINNGAMEDAQWEFLKWVLAGGHVLAGLERRREAERRLFCGQTVGIN